MGAAPVRELPVIKAAQLKEFDGFLFGFPTRYGRAPAQVSAFFDQTGGEWAAGSLVGKFAGLFTGSAGQHGGQETTIFTTLPFLMHHGITYVPLGYRAPEISNEEKIVGGSPWGSSYVAGGQGSLPVLEDDKAAGRTQGKSFAVVVMTFARGQATPVVPVAAPATAVTSEPPVADVTGPVAAQEEPSTTTATDNKHTAAVAGSAAVVAGGAAVAGANAHGSSNPLNSLGAPLGESGPVTNLTSVAPGGEDKALGPSPFLLRELSRGGYPLTLSIAFLQVTRYPSLRRRLGSSRRLNCPLPRSPTLPRLPPSSPLPTLLRPSLPLLLPPRSTTRLLPRRPWQPRGSQQFHRALHHAAQYADL